MKIKHIIFALLTAFIFVSCASTPKEEVEETSLIDKDVSQEVQENKTDISTKETAQNEYADAPKEDYEAKNNEAIKRVESARQCAIDAGAENLPYDVFREVEDLYNQRKTEYADVVSDKDLTDVCEEMASYYQVMENGARAYSARQKIEELDLSRYDVSDFEAGEAVANEIVESYYDLDLSSLSKKVDEAKNAYEKALAQGLKGLVIEARTAAVSAKKKADEVLAGVSERDFYRDTVKKMKSAFEKFVAGDMESSYSEYTEAEADFNDLTERVAARRKEAEDAIERANSQIKDVASYAENADKTAPLGDGNIEGIEEEDAVLLESETFDNPNDYVIELDESYAEDNDRGVDIQ